MVTATLRAWRRGWENSHSCGMAVGGGVEQSCQHWRLAPGTGAAGNWLRKMRSPLVPRSARFTVRRYAASPYSVSAHEMQRVRRAWELYKARSAPGWGKRAISPVLTKQPHYNDRNEWRPCSGRRSYYRASWNNLWGTIPLPQDAGARLVPKPLKITELRLRDNH